MYLKSPTIPNNQSPVSGSFDFEYLHYRAVVLLTFMPLINIATLKIFRTVYLGSSMCFCWADWRREVWTTEIWTREVHTGDAPTREHHISVSDLATYTPNNKASKTCIQVRQAHYSGIEWRAARIDHRSCSCSHSGSRCRCQA